MNKLINQLIVLPSIWRYSGMLLIALSTTYLFYQSVLTEQILLIQKQQGRLLKLENQLEHYLIHRREMSSKRIQFASQIKQISDFEKSLQGFNKTAPEQSLLRTAVKAGIDFQEANISAELKDKFGHYYLVEITTVGDLVRISRFLTLLLTKQDFAVWHQLTIVKHSDKFRLSLAIRYYFEFFDEIHS